VRIVKNVVEGRKVHKKKTGTTREEKEIENMEKREVSRRKDHKDNGTEEKSQEEETRKKKKKKENFGK
jgi:hypothetical protein